MHLGLYTPPGWDGGDGLPLVVFLHGAGDDERVLDRPGVAAELDASILEGRVPPFAMVVPEGEMGFWANWHDGTRRYEDYVVRDVIPAARRLLPVDPRPESTHLVGVSMGGTGAMTVALNNSSRFASTSVVSAPLFDAEGFERFRRSVVWRALFPLGRIYGPLDGESITEASLFERLGSPGDLGGLRLLLAFGDRDLSEARRGGEALERHLSSREIPHIALRYRGGHTWSAWRRLLPVILCLQLNEPGACRLLPDGSYTLGGSLPRARVGATASSLT
jgi:enterochelin esterase-like enzyme